MTTELAIDMFREMITAALLTTGPLLLTAIVIGVTISIFQSITSIQEQTLVFVPKLFGVSLIGIVLAPFIITYIVDYAIEVFSRLPDMLQ